METSCLVAQEMQSRVSLPRVKRKTRKGSTASEEIHRAGSQTKELQSSGGLEPSMAARGGILFHLLPGRAHLLSSFGGPGVVFSEILVVLARPDTSQALPRPISSPGPHTAARLRSFPPLLLVSFEFHFLGNHQIFRRKKGRVWRGDRASLSHSVP